MQSNQLAPQLRDAVEAAIARLGYRVTVGQVAAAAGVKLSDAEAALKALAYDSLGNLEVRCWQGGCTRGSDVARLGCACGANDRAVRMHVRAR